MKKLIVLSCLATTACVSGYNPSYFYNEVQVVNLSGTTISEVSLRVNASDRSLKCTTVRKNALCDERFGKRRFPQQGIDLSWTHGDGSQKSELLTPGIPVYFSAAFPLRVMLEIRENGTVKSYFEQEEPGRDGDFLMLGG